MSELAGVRAVKRPTDGDNPFSVVDTAIANGFG
jgi:hypothetical protein